MLILLAFAVYQWYHCYTNIVQGFTNGTIGNTICTNGNANGTIGFHNGTNGTIGKPMVALVNQWYHWLPMIPLVKLPLVPLGEPRTLSHCVCSWFYQWYQWYTDVVQGSTNGTIGTNGNANGTIGSPNGTIGKPMVPLATNGTIGKISNGTIWRTPNRPIVDEGSWFQIRMVLGKKDITSARV